ncbi:MULTISPECIES: DUF6440 family protein [Saccharibacillus]|uniref:DUF6440 family protein n=1 Tax=Saccharibacillus TaxID=456492 RepID=UPI00123990FC|nr:DUF6440 family protein [Saccharibacillus sp. WB 17]MWJ32669.1 hypothetical protein [Saccharibacillus sp. WB 17]
MLIRPSKESRFYEKSTDYLPEIGATQITVLVDRETGVNYVYAWSFPNSTGGLTPLLDANGKVVVDEI